MYTPRASGTRPATAEADAPGTRTRLLLLPFSSVSCSPSLFRGLLCTRIAIYQLPASHTDHTDYVDQETQRAISELPPFEQRICIHASSCGWYGGGQSKEVECVGCCALKISRQGSHRKATLQVANYQHPNLAPTRNHSDIVHLSASLMCFCTSTPCQVRRAAALAKDEFKSCATKKFPQQGVRLGCDGSATEGVLTRMSISATFRNPIHGKQSRPR
jgi:hypothetical protein